MLYSRGSKFSRKRVKKERVIVKEQKKGRSQVLRHKKRKRL
jgi:hypothetical protein